MEPIEIEKEKLKELQYAIDKLFSLLYYEDEMDIDIEADVDELLFEISDALDFMEVIYDVEREEIMKLVMKLVKMINATKEEMPKIYYQLYQRLQLLETRVDALALGAFLDLDFTDLDFTDEEEKEETSNNKANNDINNAISRINVNSVNLAINNICSVVNKIDVSSIRSIV